jgi:26S proteasome regulatory complex component
MIQHALRQNEYLDVAKHYYKVWETPSIKEDENDKGKAVRLIFTTCNMACLTKGLQALEHIVYFVVLAPHNNEQSDMLHHLFVDPALTKLELQ